MKTLRESAELRRVRLDFSYRLFYPQVPILVCARSGKFVAAMPANSCIPLSNAPPIIALAIGKTLRTNNIIGKSGLFSLNWISYDDAALRKKLLELSIPSKSKMPEDKLATHGIKYSLFRGIPFVENARAHVFCHVIDCLPTGDHDLFLARTIFARATNDFRKKNYWSFESYKPILYLGSNRLDPLTTLGSSRFR